MTSPLLTLKPQAAPLLLLVAAVWAVPAHAAGLIPGARAILPTTFVGRPRTATAATAPNPAASDHWSTPLFDRTLSIAERSVPLGADLQNAIGRIEPIFDPTRLDGPAFEPVLQVAAGSASPTDMFGERWRFLDDDPNVSLRLSPTALAWATSGAHGCEHYAKARPHEIGQPELTALSEWDCRHLLDRRKAPALQATPVPVAAAATSLPVFAAPLPGARMSSAAFWAAQRQRIREAGARLQRRLDERRVLNTGAR
jgi:hypothetical protein